MMSGLSATDEKLRIFVSSTINECAAERAIARKAIESLNHTAILFEAVGARPYPPRETYATRLRESDVMVAIYRQEYGWIAEGLSISGVHDEFLIAREARIPVLAYVLRPAPARENALDELLQKVMGPDGVTVAFFQEASELHDLIRDNVSAVVATRFKAGALGQLDDSRTVERLVPAQTLIKRSNVESAVIALFRHECPVLELRGELGMGKTILIHSMAQHSGWAVMDGLSDTDSTLLRIANGLRRLIGLSPIRTYDRHAIKTEICAAWQKQAGAVLALDSIPSLDVIEEIISSVGGVQSEYPIIFTLRTQVDGPFQPFDIPPFDEGEVQALWTAIHGRSLATDELLRVLRLSRGNPLYIRYLKDAFDAGPDADLRALERRRWQRLSALAQELVAYVCLLDGSIGFEQLSSLFREVGKDDRDVLVALRESADLLYADIRGYEPLHPHFRETVLALLSESLPRRTFLARRLATALRRCNDYASSFLVLLRCGLPESADIANAAASQAMRAGDFRTAKYALSARLATVGDIPSEELIDVLLGLAAAEDETGEPSRAQDFLAQAEAAATTLAAPNSLQAVQIQKASREAIRTFSPAAVETLQNTRDSLRAQGKGWQAAILSCDLSTAWLRAGMPERAAAAATEAVGVFDATGDVYGVSVARRNLGASLLATPDRYDEGLEIVQSFASDDPSQSERQRAWFLNVMSRAARRKGDNDEAKRLSNEAVGIGERLGDLRVIAINTLNMGNIARDSGHVEEALKHYLHASKTAGEAGELVLEAAAARHSASILRNTARLSEAKAFATHAAALLRGTIAYDDLGATLHELAKIQETDSERGLAARTTLESATAYIHASSLMEAGHQLTTAAVMFSAEDDVEGYCNALGRALELEATGVDVAAMAVRRIAKDLRGGGVIKVIAEHWRCISRSFSEPVLGRIFRVVMDDLASEDDITVKGLAVLGILSANTNLPLDASLRAQVIDALHSGKSGLSLRLVGKSIIAVCQLSGGRLVSIEQTNERDDGAALTLFLSIALAALEQDIGEALFPGYSLARNEVHVAITCRADFAKDGAKLPDWTSGNAFLVFRPTDLRSEKHVPTYVLYTDGLWRSAKDGHSVWSLFANLLSELMVQFFGAEIPQDLAAPAIGGMIRRLLGV